MLFPCSVFVLYGLLGQNTKHIYLVDIQVGCSCRSISRVSEGAVPGTRHWRPDPVTRHQQIGLRVMPEIATTGLSTLSATPGLTNVRPDLLSS